MRSGGGQASPKTVVDPSSPSPGLLRGRSSTRKVGLGAFTPQAIADKEVLALSKKVTPMIDDSLHTIGLDPAVVEVTMKDGNKYSRRIDVPYGSPNKQMRMEDIEKRCSIVCGFQQSLLTKSRLID